MDIPTPVSTTPTPNAVPTPATSSLQASTSVHSPAADPCVGCMKGGIPIRTELSTFLLLFFIGVSTVLAVLLVNVKREILTASLGTTPAASVSPQASNIPSVTPKPRTYTATELTQLPQPRTRGTVSVEQAISDRRSRRSFTEKPVTLQELSQMLWAAQGVTEPKTGKRTVPSAYEVYPYSVFVVVRKVDGVKPGLYEYIPATHSLADTGFEAIGSIDTIVQPAAQQAPVVFLLSASYGKGAEKLKASAMSSALLEGGHIGQNLYLEAESMKMGIVAMAGFDSKKLGEALKIDPAETIVYIMPFGNPAPETSIKE